MLKGLATGVSLTNQSKYLKTAPNCKHNPLNITDCQPIENKPLEFKSRPDHTNTKMGAYRFVYFRFNSIVHSINATFKQVY